MRVLRLGNSEDVSPGIADEDRAWYIASSMLAAESGEPVETTVKPIWPTPDLPARIARWIEEYQPDLVFLKVTWYWYTYESVPLRIRRVLGPAGKPIAAAGLKAAKQERLSKNRAFKFGRRMAHRVIGGDTPFDSHDIIELMSVCIRQIVAHESIGLMVKGTGGGRENEEALSGYYHRFLQRRDEVEGGLQRLCEELHIPWNSATKKTKQQRGFEGGDGVHKNATGQYHMGTQEGEAMVAGWRQLAGSESVASPVAEASG